MIKVEHLSKSFTGVNVLNDVSTSFERGKTNLIIGQSGSGKTVFLKSLIGLHQPDSGRITFDGIYLDELERNEQRELRKAMGMVFQGSALFDSMTVAENVCFPLQMFTTYSAKEKKEQVDRVLDRVNLIDAHHKYPAELSGGMKKRVAIARAIVMNPKYLFCDEPNSGLDPRTAILIDDLIQEITREYDITTLINTHDMNSVMQIGEKIVFLKEGKLAWQGTKEEIFVTDNQAISEFVYASELYKNVRKVYQERANLAP
ncbi:MAG: ATP-binding cassette domain-containing protein [Flavobacteriaceae bacterium]|nr:ATP-binding cassette domain-containing protein [Flavobacteriaceae bacterium]